MRLLLAALIALPHSVNAEPTLKVSETLNSSDSFDIVAEDQRLRSALALMAKQTKKEALDFLRERDLGPVKLTLRVNSDAATAQGVIYVRELLIVEGGGRRLQLTIRRDEGLQRERLREQLIRLILTAWALSDQESLPPGREPLPPWLTEGILQAIAHRRDAQSSSEFDSMLRSGAWMTPDQLFKADPDKLDTLGSGIYRGTACALIMALLNQKDGLVRLKNLVKAYASWKRSDRDLLSKEFPVLARAEDKQLEKWISLQLASLSRPSVFEPLSATETADAIRAILNFPVLEKREQVGRTRKFFRKLNPFQKTEEPKEGNGEEPKLIFLDFQGYLDADFSKQEKAPLFLDAAKRMEMLDRRAHPLFHPIVQKLAVLLREAAEGTPKNAAARIDALLKGTAGTVAGSKQITSYLDWYGANLTGLEEGAFEDYIEAMKEMGRPKRRKDPVSRVLDATETEWENAMKVLSQTPVVAP